MHSIAIGLIDDQLNDRLREEAARHGLSMEEQARRILRAGLTGAFKKSVGAARRTHLATRIHDRFRAAGSVGLPSVPRKAARPPVKF